MRLVPSWPAAPLRAHEYCSVRHVLHGAELPATAVAERDFATNLGSRPPHLGAIGVFASVRRAIFTRATTLPVWSSIAPMGRRLDGREVTDHLETA